MARFVGIKNNRVCVVSDKLFVNEDMDVLAVPVELEKLSTSDLITECVIKENRLTCKLIKKAAHEMKVAFVGNHQQMCGIATYNFFLWSELAKLVGDFKLFIEKNDEPTGDIHQLGDQLLSQDKVLSCWKRGESSSELVKELKKYDPDIILIGHEFGLWSNARYWLSMLTQLSDYRVIVVMHSVFPDHKDKSVHEAGIKELIVHLEEAKNNLVNEKHIDARVHVIQHGCYSITNQEKLWDNYKSPYTFIQQGFGHNYKMYELSIQATALLKPKYPDVFFTAIFSESPNNKVGHQMYYNELIDLVKKLELEENVAIIRGFQSDNIIDTYLRSNNVGVFPYQSIVGHRVFGSSGAARQAFSKGIPVITSTIPHFSDLPTLKADTPEEIAEQLDKLFSDHNLVVEQIKKQNEFIVANSWEVVAKKYIDVFEN